MEMAPKRNIMTKSEDFPRKLPSSSILETMKLDFKRNEDKRSSPAVSVGEDHIEEEVESKSAKEEEGCD